MKLLLTRTLSTKLTACLSLLLLCSACFVSCKNEQQKTAGEKSTDTLTEAQKHLPENALKGLTTAPGLEVHAFATEPMLKNPTNIDVDARGRVWVTEAYNYRPEINGNPSNPKGDRIMILEDTNGDDKADTAKVFYQGPEINAPLGVCVLGNRVLISQSPYIWAFYDDNGDDKADRKEILFEGIGGEQHDHGAHTFTFGPDGKLYFNFGNEGKTLKDKNGHTVRDQDGDEIGPKKYKQGMVFRCDPDGSHVECLGQNFRNPYEVAVDSYGILWQSDNDDDGNRGVRINYVMDYGNYGYTDEMTGAGWQESRTNMEDSIPYRHWHLNDPGAVPNLLQTGGGSPTGIIVYEGNLLPATFHNQLIHCDAGPNVVRAYPVKKDGAGYTASIVNILKGEKDQWFRPADVCAAPDGSIFIADWYDVGVGGHQAGDQVRGRIYRVAPSGSAYKVPAFNYTTPAAAASALQNPNLAARYLAFTALQKMGSQAVPQLEQLWHSNAEPRMRARAFWVLATMKPSNAPAYIAQAIKDNNPDLRMMGIRAARELNADVTGVVAQLVNDPDMQVRRECVLALHHNHSPQAPALWATLASAYTGKDRWYLEALGIGADGQWDSFLAAYLARINNDVSNDAAKDIIWRARTEMAVPYLAQFAADQQLPLQNRLRYFRAFDFNPGPSKQVYLIKMIEQNANNDVALNKLILHHIDSKTLAASEKAQSALQQVLQSVQGTNEYLELVRRYNLSSENNNLLHLAISKSYESIGKDAASLLLAQGGSGAVMKVINSKDTTQVFPLLDAIGSTGSKVSLDMLQQVALSAQYAEATRKRAAGNIGHSGSGEDRALELLRSKKLPPALIPDVVASVSGAWRGAVRTEAQSFLPASSKQTGKPMPDIKTLLALKGDGSAGKAVFIKTCSVCHMVNNEGYDFGPKLTEIGSKYPPEGLLDAILHPSAGISFGYEGWELKMKDGSALSGIIASKTETDIDIKFPGGSKQHLKTSNVLSRTEMKTSMMPEGLWESLSNQDMANLLAYLSSLKKK